jgi:hypothetical protein
MGQTETAAKTETATPAKAVANKKAKARREGSRPREGRPREAGRERVRYVGRNAKFRGKRVELRAVRTTKLAPCGYDVRLALGDGAQYCSVTNVKPA